MVDSWLGGRLRPGGWGVGVGGESVFNGACRQHVTAFFQLLGCLIRQGRSSALAFFLRRAPAPSKPSLGEA